MGRIRMGGNATMEFEPDYCEFHITVSAVGETSGKAITNGKKVTEDILTLLHDKTGIDIKTVTLKKEQTREAYSSRKDQKYVFEKEFYFCCKADNHITETITDLLTDMNDISYHTEYKLENISEKEQSAISVAVNNSREKAEKLAIALNSKITGFEEIRCDTNSENMYETEKFALACAGNARSLASELQNKKIEISKSVDIIWITE